MRPRPTETYQQYRERFLREYAFYPREQQDKLVVDLWKLGPGSKERREQAFDDVVDACCKAADLPEVAGVVTTLEPIVQMVWEDMLDAAAEAVAEAQRDDLGPEWILFLMQALWRALWNAPRPYHVLAMRTAAARLGALERAETAAQDLLLRIRGRFDQPGTREAVSNIVAQRMPRPAIRQGLADLFGSTRRFTVAVVDNWAYRWKWAGEALALRRSSRVETFRYWNPLDTKTTPFCRWVVASGRVLRLGKILGQINLIERAVVENNVQTAMAAWPVIDLSGASTPEQFNALFVKHDLGAPPFYWGCRTRLLPT